MLPRVLPQKFNFFDARRSATLAVEAAAFFRNW
jgi:hypothetical protein